MATGFSGSVSKSGDAIYDQPCTTCADDGLNTEACYFCKQCAQQYCNKCMNMHDKFCKDHDILCRSELDQWGSVKIPLPRCNLHGNKELEMFCPEHDEVCCLICSTVKHRSCKTVCHVTDVAKDIHKNPAFNYLPSRVDMMHTELDRLKDKKLLNHVSLQNYRTFIKSRIAMIRAKLNKRLDDMEKSSLQEMDDLVTALEQSLQSHIDACTMLQDAMSQRLNDIQVKGKDNEPYTFVVGNLCYKLLDDADALLKSINNVDDYSIEFQPAAQVEQFISSGLGKLGDLDASPYIVNVSTNSISSRPLEVENTKLYPIFGIHQLANITLTDGANKDTAIQIVYRSADSDSDSD